MVDVSYSIATRSKDEPFVEGCIVLPAAAEGSTLLRDLIAAWPYEGTFHFRGQVAAKNGKLMWLDLKSNTAKLPAIDGNCTVRAVPLFELDEAEMADPAEQRFELSPVEWQQKLHSHQDGLPDMAQVPHLDVLQSFPITASLPSVPASPRPDTVASSPRERASSGTDAAWSKFSSAANAAASFVKKHASTVDTAALHSSASAAVSGVSSFFKRAAGAAGAMLEGGPLPSEEALVNLSDVDTDLHTPFKPTHETHEALLEQLWGGAFPDQEYMRVTPTWQKLGFQSDDPATDFRGGGLLSLRCLVFFAEHYGDALRRVLATQARLRELVSSGAAVASADIDGFVEVGHGDLVSAGEDATSLEHKLYPVAITSVNLTVRLAHMVHATDKGLPSLHRRYWGVFDTHEGFFQLHCMALLFFDQLWTRQQARFDDFGQLLDLLCKRVRGWLVEGQPTSLEELRAAASELDGLVV